MEWMLVYGKEAAAMCVPKSGVGGWRFVPNGEAITIDKLHSGIDNLN